MSVGVEMLAMMHRFSRGLEGSDEAERAAIRRELEARRVSVEGQMRGLHETMLTFRAAVEGAQAKLRALHLSDQPGKGLDVAVTRQAEVSALYDACRTADALASLGRERDEILRLIAPAELAAERMVRAKGGFA